MAITNHIQGAVEKFKAKTGTELKDHVLNATYLNGLEGTSYVDLTSAQTITGTKTFDVAYANVFATGTGAGNYFQCQKFRGEGNASTYYHALDFGYAGHNQWDFFEYGGIYNFYQNTTADGSGKVNLFQISPDGVTSHKPLIAESTLTAKGAFTSSASTTLSNIKNAGILGTDSSGKVYDNSSAYQKAGNYVTIDTDQTITGRKTFNSPANVNGQEVATAIFKTSNGGRLIIGKEGPNSGTMLRFDQTAGTTRLQFRASATPGAMVWTQPEKGAKLYFDLTNSAGVSTRTTLDARSGTIARTSDIGNGKITIQKNGTDIGSFTTNQSGSKTIDLTLGVSDVSGLQSTLNGKMDTYTITEEPSSMGKNGFAQFGYDVAYQLTQYYQLSKAFGYVKVLEKGGEVSNNNSYFTGFGDVGGGTYIGTAIYDRDYNSPTGALYRSHGLLIDAYGSAFLLSGSKDSETIKRIATTDDTNSLQSSIDGKANKTHTHAISEITNLQSTLNGKANASHTHTISQINTLQDALDRKQNKIEYPCSFDNSSGSYVKLSRDGTSNYYVHIQHGVAVYGSSSQYPSISVSFPQSFGGTPTVVATFTPSSNSTGAEEAIKVTNVTSTGFYVTTRMSATVSSNYFRINWIAIYTV